MRYVECLLARDAQPEGPHKQPLFKNDVVVLAVAFRVQYNLASCGPCTPDDAAAPAPRALGILIHEMCTGEPPFGYGGDELPHRITAGLPREASSKGVMTRAGTASDLDNPGANTFNEENTGKEGSDERRFLPIVR